MALDLTPDELENVKEVGEQVADGFGDLLGRMDFQNYVTLGTKFIVPGKTAGAVDYLREKHIKCFKMMEIDFELLTGEFNEKSEADEIEGEIQEMTGEKPEAEL